MPRGLGKNPGQDMSRLQRHAKNHLGTIMGDQMSNISGYRSKDLDVLDQYYENTQYSGLQDWEESIKSDQYVPVRDRRPRVVYALPKVMVDKVASKLVGSSTFPQFVIEDDDDDTKFYRTVVKGAGVRRNLIEPIKRMLAAGSVFVRYSLVNGNPVIEYALSKFCYPVFDEAGQIEQVEIKYVYYDTEDLKANGDPKAKWYRMLLTKTSDILYDNPEYRPGSKPTFEEVENAVHDLGWVQGEWFSTHKDKFNHDGFSIYGQILDFIDDLNYSLSQSSQAVSYNQEPQLVVNGVAEEDLDALIRSTQKAWNLGAAGKAEYVNSDLKGIDAAELNRDHTRNLALDVARVVINDPEKMAGSAQSGAALNILNAPIVELVDELRAIIEPSIVSLIIKISMTLLHYMAQGMETMIVVPDGYVPSSADITCSWPPIYPPTLMDIQTAATAAASLSTGKLISRESLTRWIAAMIPSIDNVEEELAKIEAEPDLPSPFGSFGGP